MNAMKRNFGLTYNSSSIFYHALCLVFRVGLADSIEAIPADNGDQGRFWVQRLAVL